MTTTAYRPKEEKDKNETSFQEVSKNPEVSGRRDLSSVSRVPGCPPAATKLCWDVSWLQQDEELPRDLPWESLQRSPEVAPLWLSLHQLQEPQKGKSCCEQVKSTSSSLSSLDAS